jgi:hypothetical protein
LFMRRSFLKEQADQLTVSYKLVLQETDDPVPPEVEKQVREAMFKFDVAYSSGTPQQLEDAFSILREAGSLFAEKLLMQKVQHQLEKQQDDQQSQKHRSS